MQLFHFNQIQNGLFLINTLEGLNQLRDQGALSQENYEQLLAGNPYPLIYVATEHGMAAMVPNDVMEEYKAQQFWLINEDTTLEQMQAVMKFLGQSTGEPGCKSCWESKQELVKWKDFNGEVIETCPKCHGEALVDVPYTRDELITWFNAALSSNPTLVEKLREYIAE